MQYLEKLALVKASHYVSQVERCMYFVGSFLWVNGQVPCQIYFLIPTSCSFCFPFQRSFQCCFCFMLVWIEWRPAGWVDPKHWTGPDFSGHRRGYSDTAELGRIHGAQRQGRDAVRQLFFLILASWLVSSIWKGCEEFMYTSLSLILSLLLIFVLLPRVHCLWEMIMALSSWVKEQQNVEHMPRPFTTRSWNFKRVLPQPF